MCVSTYAHVCKYVYARVPTSFLENIIILAKNKDQTHLESSLKVGEEKTKPRLHQLPARWRAGRQDTRFPAGFTPVSQTREGRRTAWTSHSSPRRGTAVSVKLQSQRNCRATEPPLSAFCTISVYTSVEIWHLSMTDLWTWQFSYLVKPTFLLTLNREGSYCQHVNLKSREQH